MRRGSYLRYGMHATTTDLLTERDLKADAALQDELAMLRDDISPAWLQDPPPLEETAERFIRPQMRDTFVALCRGSVAEYLDRFDFESELLVAMYVVTDGMSGSQPDGHPRQRPQLGAQHVPAPRRRRDVDDRPGRHGHRLGLLCGCSPRRR